MKGNTIKIWSILLAVCIWWPGGVQSHATGNSSTSDSVVGAPSYPVVRFNTSNANELTYGEMINSLRKNLLESGAYSRGIPLLRDPASVRDSERYVLLEIRGSNGNVEFAIDVTNVYVVGYRIGNTAYFFQEAPENAGRLLFTSSTRAPDRRSSNYQSLESRAGARRASIPLGLHALEHAIAELLSRPEDPRSLLVVIQMVAEAVRYWEIETRVRRSSSESGSFRPDNYMIDLENNWGALSEQIQRSDQLAFERPIVIGNMIADNVNSYVISGIFLMLYVCNPASSALSSAPYLQIMRSDLDLEAEDTCKHLVNPRTRIRGRNGLCVDVEGFIYRDKNPIVLANCRSNDPKNQLWTMERDGRIVSLEKCLAATGNTPGSSVMIHECDTLDSSAVEWTMGYYGILSNKHSGLVLTAPDGSHGSKLTLEKYSYSSFQAWKSTNNLNAVDVYIHGEKNQCIYYNGRRGIYTEQCSKGSSRQKWRLYPDSTIRPLDWLDGCLELQSLVRNYNYIQAGDCGANPVHQRWAFTHRGSIMNLKSNLVVDADESNPGYLQAAPFKGGPNQIWTLGFI